MMKQPEQEKTQEIRRERIWEKNFDFDVFDS